MRFVMVVMLFFSTVRASSQTPAVAPSNPSPANTTPTAQGAVIVSLDIPATISIGIPTQMTMTVSAPQPTPAMAVTVEVPNGVTAVPQNFEVPAGSLTWNKVIVLDTRTSAVPGDKRILVTLISAGTPGSVAASVVGKFKLLPLASTGRFLAVALLGVAFGYVLRLFVGILKSLPTPAPAPVPPAPALATGRLTQFVKSHYYWVDFAVTLAIGFLILVGLLSGGRPPENASAWYGALTVGVALGLLTNSELITRVR